MRTSLRLPVHRSSHRGSDRRGFTLLEVVVSISLTVVMIGIVTPMVVRSMRLWKDTQRYQLATDELAIQLDRLISLPPDERSEAIEQLSVNDAIAAQFPGGTLSADLVSGNSEQRLVLAFNWERPGDPPPIQLIGWINTTAIEATAIDRPAVDTSTDETNEAITPAGDLNSESEATS